LKQGELIYDSLSGRVGMIISRAIYVPRNCGTRIDKKVDVLWHDGISRALCEYLEHVNMSKRKYENR